MIGIETRQFHRTCPLCHRLDRCLGCKRDGIEEPPTQMEHLFFQTKYCEWNCCRTSCRAVSIWRPPLIVSKTFQSSSCLLLLTQLPVHLLLIMTTVSIRDGQIESKLILVPYFLFLSGSHEIVFFSGRPGLYCLRSLVASAITPPCWCSTLIGYSQVRLGVPSFSATTRFWSMPVSHDVLVPCPR